jgi:hypothetical protein
MRSILVRVLLDPCQRVAAVIEASRLSHELRNGGGGAGCRPRDQIKPAVPGAPVITQSREEVARLRRPNLAGGHDVAIRPVRDVSYEVVAAKGRIQPAGRPVP